MNPPLIAISSFRPLDASPEIAANQIRANLSWQKAFDGIILFGHFDKRLDSPKTQFIPTEEYPRLATLIFAAAQCGEPACILNADIVVAEELPSIANQAWQRGSVAWTSKRYEFNPANPDYAQAKVVDQGADIFCAQPWIWSQAYRKIPGGYRLGGPTWDSWLLGFFTLTFKRKFVDLTALRPIFHPKHGQRIRPNMGEIPRDKYIDSGVGFPSTL